MNAHKLLFLKLFFIACLTGCAAVPAAPEFAAAFTLRGKVGVSDLETSYSAGLLWRQGAEQFVIDIWGPLGQGRVQLRGDAGRLSLVDGQGRILRSGSPQDVMTAELGWYLPLEVLPVWVLGTPDKGAVVGAEEYDEHGRLVAFTQLDWRVVYDRFRSVATGAGERFLPYRITAMRDAYRVRLAVSGWEF